MSRFRRQSFAPNPARPFEVLVLIPGYPTGEWCACAGWVDAHKEIHAGGAWSVPWPLAPMPKAG